MVYKDEKHLQKGLEGVKVGEATVFLRVGLFMVRITKICWHWALWVEQENVKGTVLLLVREGRADFVFHSTDILLFGMADPCGWELNWPHLSEQAWERVIPTVPFLPWVLPLLCCDMGKAVVRECPGFSWDGVYFLPSRVLCFEFLLRIMLMKPADVPVVAKSRLSYAKDFPTCHVLLVCWSTRRWEGAWPGQMTQTGQRCIP